MLSSHHTTRSGGYDFAFFRHSVVAAGFAAALFVGQALPAAAQGNRPGQQQEAPPEDSEVDEVELTAKQVDGFIATQKEITPITAKLQGSAQPTPQMMSQMEAVAKKNGFKDFDEFGDVGGTIGMVFSGIDPQSKKYDPEGLIKQEIAAVTADAKIPPAEKKQILQDLQQAAGSAPKLKYPANADLVIKNYDRLKPVLEQQ
jgi:hypothetical protein